MPRFSQSSAVLELDLTPAIFRADPISQLPLATIGSAGRPSSERAVPASKWAGVSKPPGARGGPRPGLKASSSTKSYEGLTPDQVKQYDADVMGSAEQDEEEEEYRDTRIPITLVSGFLGEFGSRT